MKKSEIFQLYIELEDFEPKIWRKIEIYDSSTLAELAYTIMVLYEIREYYYYQFKIDEAESYKIRHPEYARKPERLEQLKKQFCKAKYGVTNKKNIYLYNHSEDEYGPLGDATKIQLNECFHFPQDQIIFFYDPEVNWKFKIILEKSSKNFGRYYKDMPLVSEGKGYGIIESCSSLKQLAEFREKSKDYRWREKSGYQFYQSLNQSRFQFDQFDVEDMNIRLREMSIAIKKRFEENQIRFPDRIYQMEKRDYVEKRKKSRASIDKTKK